VNCYLISSEASTSYSHWYDRTLKLWMTKRTICTKYKFIK